MSAERTTAGDMRAQRSALVAATGGHERDLDDLARQLERWLTPRLGGDRVVVSGVHPPEGAGVSNETFLFDLTWDTTGGTQTRRLVLRVKPSAVQLFPDPDFEGQYQLLEVLQRTRAVRVPEVLWFEPEAAPFGAPAYVMSCLEGRVPVSAPVYNQKGWLFDATPRQRRTLWISAVEELARIHLVPIDGVSFIGWPELGTTGNDQQIGYWQRYRSWCTGGFAAEAFLAIEEWVQANRPRHELAGLSWGDARIGNMMFDGDFQLVGVLDWEQASLGGPRHDLGWWLMFDDFHSTGHGLARLDGLGDRRETIELWEDRTGLEAGDLSWYEAFAAHKLALITLRTMLVGGRSPDEATAIASVFLERARAAAGLGAVP